MCCFLQLFYFVRLQKALAKKLTIMGKYEKNIELRTGFSYFLYTVFLTGAPFHNTFAKIGALV